MVVAEPTIDALRRRIALREQHVVTNGLTYNVKTIKLTVFKADSVTCFMYSSCRTV